MLQPQCTEPRWGGGGTDLVDMDILRGTGLASLGGQAPRVQSLGDYYPKRTSSQTWIRTWGSTKQTKRETSLTSDWFESELICGRWESKMVLVSDFIFSLKENFWKCLKCCKSVETTFQRNKDLLFRPKTHPFSRDSINFKSICTLLLLQSEPSTNEGKQPEISLGIWHSPGLQSNVSTCRNLHLGLSHRICCRG